MNNERLLVVDDEEIIRDVLQRMFAKSGYRVECCASAEEAIKLGPENYDLMLVDLRLPGMNGLDLISHAAQEAPNTVTVMMTSFSTVESAVEAMKRGAFEYVIKPFNNEELRQVVARALKSTRMDAQNRQLQADLQRCFPSKNIIGESQAIRQMENLIERVAATTATVLLLGESGTGKELVARAIHERSPRREYPFIPINCAALPEQLLESELLGHVKGAFTGAVSNRNGLAESARGGTLFLDEIGDLPLALQARLLRFLQEHEVRPVGGTRTIRVDVRVITATNVNLEEKIKSGQFREDLYYRINGFSISIPPLRERKDDLLKLANHFLLGYGLELGKTFKGVSADAEKVLLGHDWPGNVRELKNVIERGAILEDSQLLQAASLPFSNSGNVGITEEAINELCSLDEYFRRFLLRHQNEHSETRLAQMLGISRKNLWERRQRLEIPRPGDEEKGS